MASRWPLAVRAATSTAIPVLVGSAVGNVGAGLIATLGAFTARFGGDRPYLNRGVQLAVVSVSLAAAVAVGSWAAQVAWLGIAVVSVVAVAAVWLCNALAVGPPGAYVFALACAAGVGVSAAKLAPWQLGALVLCGGSVAWLVQMAGALRERRRPERVAVAAAGAAVAAYVEAVGSAGETAARHRAAAALHAAWNALIGFQPTSRADVTLQRLRAANHALHVLFADTMTATAVGDGPPPDAADAARQIGGPDGRPGDGVDARHRPGAARPTSRSTTATCSPATRFACQTRHGPRRDRRTPGGRGRHAAGDRPCVLGDRGGGPDPASGRRSQPHAAARPRPAHRNVGGADPRRGHPLAASTGMVAGRHPGGTAVDHRDARRQALRAGVGVHHRRGPDHRDRQPPGRRGRAAAGPGQRHPRRLRGRRRGVPGAEPVPGIHQTARLHRRHRRRRRRDRAPPRRRHRHPGGTHRARDLQLAAIDLRDAADAAAAGSARLRATGERLAPAAVAAEHLAYRAVAACWETGQSRLRPATGSRRRRRRGDCSCAGWRPHCAPRAFDGRGRHRVGLESLRS